MRGRFFRVEVRVNYNYEDQIAIFIFWLTLLSLGFEIQDQDLLAGLYAPRWSSYYLYLLYIAVR